MAQVQADPQLSPLVRLVANALQYLEERGFSARSRRYYEVRWNRLVRFAQEVAPHCTQVQELEAAFLTKCGIKAGAKRSDLTWSQDVTRRGLRILIEFQDTGQFDCHQKRTEEPSMPVLLRQELDRYEGFCRQHLRHRATTIAARRHVLRGFLNFVGARGMTSLAELQPPLLDAFISERALHLNLRSLAKEVGCVRSLLRFLCVEGVVAEDLAAHARASRFSKEHRLPRVWPAEAVEQLLAAVDRTSSVGKRDYAILVLAARLGLRACDIRALKLDNIEWADDRLTLTQSKTGRPLSLPLSEEVGRALIDYLRHARPQSPHREVFLKARAPHEPFGSTNPFHSVITSALRRANISPPEGMPHGLHSLRHTLATTLVKAGQPLEAVAGVLGHSSIESTGIYTHLDVSSLREVALDSEEVFHA